MSSELVDIVMVLSSNEDEDDFLKEEKKEMRERFDEFGGVWRRVKGGERLKGT